MIPQHIKDELDRYVRYGTLIGGSNGGFLLAVLSNDLAESLRRANDENRAALYDIVLYVRNELPAACWGSLEAVASWTDH